MWQYKFHYIFRIVVDDSQLCVQLNAWFLRQSEKKLRQYISQQPIFVRICSEFVQKNRVDVDCIEEQQSQMPPLKRARQKEPIEMETSGDELYNIIKWRGATLYSERQFVNHTLRQINYS